MNYVRVGLAKYFVKGIFYTLDFKELPSSDISTDSWT